MPGMKPVDARGRSAKVMKAPVEPKTLQAAASLPDGACGAAKTRPPLQAQTKRARPIRLARNGRGDMLTLTIFAMRALYALRRPDRMGPDVACDSPPPM